MSRLTILENQVKKEPEDQFKQINLALQTISQWGNRINTNLSVDFTDSSTANELITSTNYVRLSGFTFSFTPTSNLISYMIKLNVSSTVESEIGVFIDDSIVEYYRTAIPNSNTMIITGTREISGNSSHTIAIAAKVLTAGTITKYSTGNNKVQVVSLVT